jgi:hypothetical protein
MLSKVSHSPTDALFINSASVGEWLTLDFRMHGTAMKIMYVVFIGCMYVVLLYTV